MVVLGGFSSELSNVRAEINPVFQDLNQIQIVIVCWNSYYGIRRKEKKSGGNYARALLFSATST